MSPDLTVLQFGMEFEQVAIAATVLAAAVMTIAMLFLVYASFAPDRSSAWAGESDERGGSYDAEDVEPATDEETESAETNAETVADA